MKTLILDSAEKQNGRGHCAVELERFACLLMSMHFAIKLLTAELADLHTEST